MSDALEWLLQPDPANPGVRFFALRDLLDHPASGPAVQAAMMVCCLTDKRRR